MAKQSDENWTRCVHFAQVRRYRHPNRDSGSDVKSESTTKPLPYSLDIVDQPTQVTSRLESRVRTFLRTKAWYLAVAVTVTSIFVFEPGATLAQAMISDGNALGLSMVSVSLDLIVVPLLGLIFVKLWTRPDLIHHENLHADGLGTDEAPTNTPTLVRQSCGQVRTWVSGALKQLVLLAIALGFSFADNPTIRLIAVLALVFQIIRVLWFSLRWLWQGRGFVAKHWKTSCLVALAALKLLAPLVAYDGSSVRGSTAPAYSSAEVWFITQTACAEYLSSTWIPPDCRFETPDDPRWSVAIQRSMSNGMWAIGRTISSLGDSNWATRPKLEREDDLTGFSFGNAIVSSMALFLLLRRRLIVRKHRMLIIAGSVMLFIGLSWLSRSMDRGLLEVVVTRLWFEIFLFIAIPLTGLIELVNLLGLVVHEVADPQIISGLLALVILIVGAFFLASFFSGGGSTTRPKPIVITKPVTYDKATGKRTLNSHFNSDGSEKKGYKDEMAAMRGAVEHFDNLGDKKRPYECGEPECPQWHIGGSI